jgi:hypothetical protein
MEEFEYWLFINVKSQMRSRKISQQKADLLIKKLNKEDVECWYAWTSLFRDWIPLKNIVVEKDGFFQLMIQIKDSFVDADDNDDESTLVTTHVPAKYLEVESLIENIPIQEIDFFADQLTLSNIPNPPSLNHFFDKEFNQGNILKGVNSKAERAAKTIGSESDRRGATRYEINVDVLILGKGLSFRAETVNLSQTGALLVKPLPEVLADVPLEVVFIFKKGNVHEKFAVKGKVLSTRDNLRYLTFGSSSSEDKKAFERLIKIYFQEINR